MRWTSGREGMMGKKVDLTGKVFGRFTVLGPAANKGKVTMWLCRCECGTVKTVAALGLVGGRSKSCGCLHKEIVGNMSRKHGLYRNRTYRVWMAMIHRCYQKQNKSYAIYGGRGIAVCEEWRNSYACFLKDMGEVPKGKFYLDRIDNDGNYCKENCRWVNSTENIRNRSVTYTIEWGGETRRLVDVAEELGIKPSVAYTRIARQGWSAERALKTGVREYTQTTFEIVKGDTYRYRKEERTCKVIEYTPGSILLLWDKTNFKSRCGEKHFFNNFKKVQPAVGG